MISARFLRRGAARGSALVRHALATKIRLGGALAPQALVVSALVVSTMGALATGVPAAIARAATAAEQWQPEDWETKAWQHIAEGEPIAAREIVDKHLGEHPQSFVGHTVLALVLHYTEGAFPRALFHCNKAIAAIETRFGAEPQGGQVWRWHAQALREKSSILGDLERHEQRLRSIARYNRLYEPDQIADRAWPLMKLRRFDEARAAARRALRSQDPTEIERALNAQCAIEFEAGNNQASYRACRQAMEHAQTQEGGPSAVDLTNFAEAARSLFRLEEAEDTLLRATEARPAWYGNPWLELAELYLRQARFSEALGALRQVQPYRNARPPHVRNADLSESKRALASFLLLVGRPQDANRLTAEALVTPDRRGHNSRDPEQDRLLIALLHRSTKQSLAERRLETAAATGWLHRPMAWLQAMWLRFEGWLSAQRARKALAERKRLVGILQVGAATSAATPPWIVGDLVPIVGAGVMLQALRQARKHDPRSGAKAYYAAFAAEAYGQRGDLQACRQQAKKALANLPASETLLRARTSAVAGRCAHAAAQPGDSLRAYRDAMRHDPGVLRRLGISLPVRLASTRPELNEPALDFAKSSPRFRLVGNADEAFSIEVRLQGTRMAACLQDLDGSKHACAEQTLRSQASPDDLLGQVLQKLQQQAFAPRIDLSQRDVNTLDGSNRVARDPLDLIP